MPLIACPDCETMVSDQADACPKCARPTPGVTNQQMMEQRAEDAAAFEAGKQVGGEIFRAIFWFWMLNFVIAVFVWLLFGIGKYGFPIRALFLGPFHWI